MTAKAVISLHMDSVEKFAGPRASISWRVEPIREMPQRKMPSWTPSITFQIGLSDPGDLGHVEGANLPYLQGNTRCHSIATSAEFVAFEYRKLGLVPD